jgi:hypothetical protein
VYIIPTSSLLPCPQPNKYPSVWEPLRLYAMTANQTRKRQNLDAGEIS